VNNLQFSYDSLGRLTTYTNQDNKVITYGYDTEDNLTKLTYPDGKVVNYAYDEDNRLIKVTDWLGNVTEYKYDGRGNLTTGISPGLLSIYKYDTVGRLNKLVNYNRNTLAVTSGFEFGMDKNSNRINIKRYLPLVGAVFPTVSASYAYNSDNQLITGEGNTFSYDENGNTTAISPQTSAIRNFTYNYNDELTQYASGTTTLNYQYDILGNRIKKTSTTSTTKYIVDPNQGLPSVIAETDINGNITAYYIYGLGLVSKIEGSNAYYYQYDGLGSTIAITDTTGAVKNKYAYDDFGNVASNSTETISNPFKYVGGAGVITDLPDLLFMRARYYLPSVGRFANKDPIGFGGGINMYNYVYSNPINFIDPTGLNPDSDAEFCAFADRKYWEGDPPDPAIKPLPIWEEPAFTVVSLVTGGGPTGWLFGRGGTGILNSNPFIRIGWGWKGTREAGKLIFRIAIGSKRGPIHWHFP